MLRRYARATMLSAPLFSRQRDAIRHAERCFAFAFRDFSAIFMLLLDY